MTLEKEEITESPSRAEVARAQQSETLATLDSYRYGWSDADAYAAAAVRGLSEDVVSAISATKHEPEWMAKRRLKALSLFYKKPLPVWGADLSRIDFDSIKYFVRSTEAQAATWEDLPAEIKNTYDRLGIPEAEKQRLVAGVAAQYECLAGSTPVWTERGAVPISEVKEDDVVLSRSPDGSLVPARVLATRNSGVKLTYTVRAGEHSLRASANHPFLVREGDTLSWRPLEDIAPGTHLAVVEDDSSPALSFAPLAHKEPFDEEETWDIQVEGHHNFVAAGFLVHNSEVVYHKIREDLEAQGVVFLDTDTALREHEDVFKEYFGSVIPSGDNKFAALNTAAWSGGSFVYVPPGVHVDIPLQAYFRINTENMGQFERTLIIADEGSSVHYVEGCLLPGEEIRLPGGMTKPVEDVALDDLVLDHTGKASQVTSLMRRPFDGLVYSFTPFSTANTFTTTGEHPLLLVRRDDVKASRSPRRDWKPEVSTTRLLAATPEWVRAEEVREGDFMVFPKNRAEAPAEILPHALCRLAGYYLAEGSAQIINGCKALTFALHQDELDIAEDIRSLCEELYQKRGSLFTDPSKHALCVTVYTPEGYDFMKENVGTRSHQKRLSSLLFNQPLDSTRALVQAYVLGDGNTVQRGPSTQVRPATTSRDWAFQLQSLLTREDVFATVRLERPAGPATIMGRPVTRHDLYKVVWTPEKTMGAIRDAGEHFLVPIRTITTAPYSGAVYNVETTPGNSYLVKGFATHNCTAPIYSSDSLHSAVVEIIVKKGARVRYTTIQNWSNNVFNLVTKRAVVQEGGRMEWVDANLGCLAEGSMLTTPAGAKPIQDVEVGDEVLAYDEDSEELCFRRVTAKRYSGLQPVREVRSGDRSLLATDNHPFYTLRPSATGDEPGYVRTDQLSQVGSVLLPSPSALERTRSSRSSSVHALLTHPLERTDVSVSQPVATLPTWDIEVAGTGNFVAEGFIVHNSQITMKYPACYLVGERASGETLSIALAGSTQHQDAGAKMVHAAPHTSSTIVSKSIAHGGGRTSYRGLVQIQEGATGSKSSVKCDALLVDTTSRSDTYPYVDVREDDVSMGHEATVSAISADQLFYLMSRGLTEDEATAMIVRGFIEPVARELPMEYALELNRLIDLQMEGAVG